MITTLASVVLNDRVILPPFASQVNNEFHQSRRCEARRVLAVSREGDAVTIVLDGQEPRTLPASLRVLVLY